MTTKLSFVGLGKLGLPLAALFAQSGLQTVGIDIDVERIGLLSNDQLEHDETGLALVLSHAGAALRYASDYQAAAATDASVILVPTESNKSSPAFSLANVEAACRGLCLALKSRPVWQYHLFVIASTLYPGSLKSIIALLENELGRVAGRDFGVAYVPELVALGSVVQGFQSPPFLLVGGDDKTARVGAAELFRRIQAPSTPQQHLSAIDAEVTKLAFNVFLCLKISFGNQLAQMGERLGGLDLDGIARLLELDPRIGKGLLRGGAPFGGACFPRDVDAFTNFASSLDMSAPLAQAAAEVNAAQYDLIYRELLQSRPKVVAVLGLSFKAGTPVISGSPALEWIRRLLADGIRVSAYDPLEGARDETRALLEGRISCFDKLADCVRGVDGVLVCNADGAFEMVLDLVENDVPVIDPWGLLKGSHPGLRSIGRRATLHEAVKVPA